MSTHTQDPTNLQSRDLSQFDYVKKDKKVEGEFNSAIVNGIEHPTDA